MVEDIKALYGFIEKVVEKGKIVKGVNEVTKQIEKGNAKLVVNAQDVDPKEILMHIPILCKKKGIPLAEVPSKTELGKSAKLPVNCSSLAITDFGGLNEEAKHIITKLIKE
jgi:large subunit ribosomal protein L7Ae